MMVLRENDSAIVQHGADRGVLKDYSMKHIVEVQWNLNPEAIRDQMFIMKIDGVEVILDAEEVMRMVRWV